jgi:tetratricopeptide (TPR) repeat protein
VLADIGALELLTSRFAEAVPPLAAALDAFVGHRDTERATAVALNLATALVHEGDETRAVCELRRTADQLDLAPGERGRTEESFGDALLATKEPAAAARAYDRAAVHIRESGAQISEYLAQAAAKLSDLAPSAAVRLYTAALASYPGVEIGVARYQLRNDRALVLVTLGQHDQATEDLQTALQEATSAEDRPMRVLVLTNLSEVLRRRGSLQEAIAYAEQAVSDARALRNRLLEASSLATLGLSVAAVDDWARARESFRESLMVARSLGARETEAIALGGLAQTDFARGRYGTARNRYRRAAEIEEALGDRAHQTESLAALIETDAMLRDAAAFESDFQRLIDLVQRQDGSLDVAEVGISRAARAWLRGRRATAIPIAGEAFGVAILLRLWQLTTNQSDEVPSGFGGAFVAPYVYSAALDPRLIDRIEHVIAETIRAKAGRRAERFVREMLAIGRSSALAALTERHGLATV